MRAHGFHVGFLLPWIVALSLLLSGCAGSDGETGSSPDMDQPGRQQEPASAKEAASTEGKVLLTVTDTAGNPASGAVVRLSGALAVEGVTDTDGNSLFTGLPPGSYTLQASKGDTSHPNIHLEVTGSESLERRASGSSQAAGRVPIRSAKTRATRPVAAHAERPRWFRVVGGGHPQWSAGSFQLR